MMRQAKLIPLVILCAVGACSGNVKQTLGLGKQAPDEFKVVANQPLSVPPDFRLVTPTPGAKRPYAQDLDAQAEAVLFSSNQSGAVVAPSATGQANRIISAGERLLLNDARGQANPNIRDLLQQQEQVEIVEEEKGFFAKLWSKDATKDDPKLNATAEKKRITNAKQEGEEVTGDEAEIIEQKDRGVLGEWLDF